MAWARTRWRPWASDDPYTLAAKERLRRARESFLESPIRRAPIMAAGLGEKAAVDAGLIAVNGITVHPTMVPYVQALRRRASVLGARFKLVSGYRSPSEQARLRLRWARGDPSVIYPPARHSYHELGLAVDVDSDQLEQLGRYAESLGMRWGGRFGDPVHFDLGRRN